MIQPIKQQSMNDCAVAALAALSGFKYRTAFRVLHPGVVFNHENLHKIRPVGTKRFVTAFRKLGCSVSHRYVDRRRRSRKWLRENIANPAVLGITVGGGYQHCILWDPVDGLATCPSSPHASRYPVQWAEQDTREAEQYLIDITELLWSPRSLKRVSRRR